MSLVALARACRIGLRIFCVRAERVGAAGPPRTQKVQECHVAVAEGQALPLAPARSAHEGKGSVGRHRLDFSAYRGDTYSEALGRQSNRTQVELGVVVELLLHKQSTGQDQS